MLGLVPTRPPYHRRPILDLVDRLISPEIPSCPKSNLGSTRYDVGCSWSSTRGTSGGVWIGYQNNSNLARWSGVNGTCRREVINLRGSRGNSPQQGEQESNQVTMMESNTTITTTTIPTRVDIDDTRPWHGCIVPAGASAFANLTENIEARRIATAPAAQAGVMGSRR